MDNFHFSYFLRSTPPLTAKSYIKRVFKLNFSARDNQPVNIFVRYYRDSTPQSYINAQGKFPRNCFLQSDFAPGPRFILAANIKDFINIVNFISGLPCKRLIREIEKEFAGARAEFKIGGQTWKKDKPRVMGILNVTPDSFYDGGKHFQLPDYAPTIQKMIEAGADIIDIGGESSRPNSSPVSESDEIKRVLPALRQIKERFHIPVSIDTVKPGVAKAALEMGADMINDISGLSPGKEMIEPLLQYKAGYCLTHIQGEPKNMQNNPRYSDVVAEVYRFFQKKMKFCRDLGLNNNRILIDPGVGFGKLVEHNLDLLRFISAFSNLNSLILIGVSNKSFIGALLGREINERSAGGLTVQALGWTGGAAIFRAHNVKESKDSLTMAFHCGGV